MAALDHPMKPALERLRTVVFAALNWAACEAKLTT